MIDFHTHILPNIDDGAKNREEALAMLQLEEIQQVTHVVVTPHFYPSQCSLNEFVAKREKVYAQLSSQYNGAIKLHLASETLLSQYLLQYPSLKALCVEGTNHLLLELPYTQKWEAIVWDTIFAIIDRFDIVPIIAHVERYAPILHKPKRIQRLLDMGCYIQMNGESVLKRESSKMALKLIKSGYIDVIGSDCHNTTSRKPILKDAFQVIGMKLGNEAVAQLEQTASELLTKFN